MMTPDTWEWTKRISTVLSLIGVVATVLTFFIYQNVRIGRLEAQMQATTITTTLKSADNGGQPSSLVTINPVQQACADLGKRLADAAYGTGENIKSAMSGMACDRLPSK